MRIVTQYLHHDDDESTEHLNLTEGQWKNVQNVLYEVEFEIDVDTGRILSVKSGQQILGQ